MFRLLKTIFRLNIKQYIYIIQWHNVDEISFTKSFKLFIIKIIKWPVESSYNGQALYTFFRKSTSCDNIKIMHRLACCTIEKEISCCVNKTYTGQVA